MSSDTEIVWLAYDAQRTESAWQERTIREVYSDILADEYRRRVDPRSMLFHKAQFYLLDDLEQLMKCGGINITLEEYLAKLFHKGVEEFPAQAGELRFDHRLISYYTSLRMADDYHLVEGFLGSLLVEAGVADAGKPFRFTDPKNRENLFVTLEKFDLGKVQHAASAFAESADVASTCSRLVMNYIEFYHYALNNGLQVFGYIDSTDPKHWGDLVQRKAGRDKRIVALTYSTETKKTAKRSVRSTDESSTLAINQTDVISKLKFKRRIDNLLVGLKDIDPLIRQKAAEGLGITKNFTAVGALIGTLSDEVPEVRVEAVKSLGIIKDPRSIDAIIQLVLRDESVSVVMSAAQAVVELADPRGLEALIEVLLRGMHEVAVQIALFPQLVKQKTAVNMLIQAMAHPNEVVRRQVAFILGEIPGKVSIDVLMEALADDDQQVRMNAASSLGRNGSKRVLPSLYEYRKGIVAVENRWVVEQAIDNILEKGRANV